MLQFRLPGIRRAAVAVSITAFAVIAVAESEKEQEQEVPVQNLPAAVLSIAEAQAKALGGNLESAELETEGGKQIYSVEIKKADGGEVELEIDPSGTLLKTEIEDDEDADENEESLKISVSELPASVQASLQKHLKGSTAQKAEKETERGTTSYEVEYSDNGIEKSLKFSESGELLEAEAGISTSSLPAAVSARISRRFAGAEIRKAESVEVHFYELDVLVNGKKKEVKVDATGRLLGSDEEDD